MQHDEHGNPTTTLSVIPLTNKHANRFTAENALSRLVKGDMQWSSTKLTKK